MSHSQTRALPHNLSNQHRRAGNSVTLDNTSYYRRTTYLTIWLNDYLLVRVMCVFVCVNALVCILGIACLTFRCVVLCPVPPKLSNSSLREITGHKVYYTYLREITGHKVYYTSLRAITGHNV